MVANPQPRSNQPLSPHEAVERFLDVRSMDSSERTIRSYSSRLERFLEWCDLEDIDAMSELDSLRIDDYRVYIQGGDREGVSVKGVLATFRVFLKYCEEIGVVERNLHAAVQVPTLDPVEETSDERLETQDAIDMLEYFRQSTALFGIDQHALLELTWHIGARVGGIRALDLTDYRPEEREIEFVHRPSTGTPLKNKSNGERIVGVSEQVADALDMYISRERHNKRDENGREPLFATRQGRAVIGTLRGWCYLATEPCYHMECPHGRQRPRCEYTERNKASRCPSSRSPHAVRQGSIIWQLNRGIKIEIVAERVNSTPAVIRRYYDHATKRERYEERRQDIELQLDISGGED